MKDDIRITVESENGIATAIKPLDCDIYELGEEIKRLLAFLGYHHENINDLFGID